MVDDGKIRRSCKNADDPQTVIETFVKYQGIDRDKEIYSLVRFLNSIEGHYVIALDGGWGCGKSFFVRHTMLFHEMLPMLPVNAEDAEKKEAFRKKYNKVSEKIEVEDNGEKKEEDTWETVVSRCNSIKGEKKDNGKEEKKDGGEKKGEGTWERVVKLCRKIKEKVENAWKAVVKRCNDIIKGEKKDNGKGEKKDGGEKEGEIGEDKDVYLYYDAWKNDAFGDDPIISLLCEIVEEKKSKFGKVFGKLRDWIQNRVPWKVIFCVSLIILVYVAFFFDYRKCPEKNWMEWLVKAISCWLTLISGIESVRGFWKSDLRDIQKYVDKEFKNKIFQEKTNTLLHEKISTVLLGELQKRKKSRFIIFIDELDRCNPLFAVKVLERVKHYFDNPNLVFVFSVNLEQLQHTIRNVYGQEFDAMTYLHRFFDKQISLQRPSIDALVRGKLENHASGEFCKVARYAIDCYKFHIREILQFLDELDDVCGAISYLIKTQNLKNDIEFDYDPEKDRGSKVYNAETNAYFFAFDIIIPLLIGLRIKNRNVYDAVLNDKDVNTDVSKHIRRYFRENRNGLWSRALKSWTSEQMSGRPLTKQDLDRIYSAMFPLWNHDAAATVGQLDFSKRVREQVKELLSGLAKQRQEKESWDSSYQKYWNDLTGISYKEGEVSDDGSPDISKDRRDIIEEYFKERKIIYRTKEHKKAGNILIISLSETVQMEFVWCPAGTFTMGSPKAELGRADNETPHEVRLTKGFWIGKYPVTQAQYDEITRRIRSYDYKDYIIPSFDGEITLKTPSYYEGATRPVERVFWHDSVAFCESLNELRIAPVGYRFALPTEAQWEYACRAGTTTALNNGKPVVSEKDWCPNLDEVGWYSENSGNKTHPVGEKRPNGWGIYDMHGNVREWCADWYYDYPRGAVPDPTGPETGEIRVLRGGSWDYGARYCRSAARSGDVPGYCSDLIGFRLVLIPEQKLHPLETGGAKTKREVPSHLLPSYQMGRFDFSRSILLP